MINKLEISIDKVDADDDIKKYIRKKIGRLDSYMPRHARKSVHGEVRITDATIKAKKQYKIDITFFLPGETINAEETTVNMYAAVDIVEEKLKTQLRKYKAAVSESQQTRRQRARQYIKSFVKRS